MKDRLVFVATLGGIFFAGDLSLRGSVARADLFLRKSGRSLGKRAEII